LVDAILPHAIALAARQGSVRLLDLGTGTGAIALALLAEVPELTAVGVDLSPGALETARLNADLNGIGARFETLESHWFDRVEGQFDIIVSNPPYIRSDVIPALDPDVRNFDPLLALDGGKDGLEAYRVLARGASAHIVDGGIIGLEIGYDQNNAVSELFLSHDYHLLEARSDLGGQDRVLVFAKK
jgi:release factor glutamine methyltransferase